MCEYLSYSFKASIINISLDIPVGAIIDLTEAEIKELNELIEPSSKTEEASLPKPEAPKRRNEFIKETIKIQEKRRL
jgi:23S rRNA pseudouridine2604 synthase